MGYKIIDRRHEALGGQSNDRPLSAITTIVWHYTAVARNLKRFITNHEAYWRDSNGWDRGGYHFYIDADGNIYQNYNYERMTWGVADSNWYTVHITCEAGSGTDYSQAQIEAREWLTRKIMADLNISAKNVKGHWEVNNNSKCPGYDKAQMDAFRAKLAQPAVKVDAAIATEKQLQPYKGRNDTWKVLKVGDSVTIRAGAKRWLNANFKQMEQMAKDYTGVSDTITEVKAVKIGYSDFAYKLKKLKVWVLEQDLIEPRKEPKALYKVQTGAFSNPGNAKKRADELNKKGVETYIVKE